MTNAVESEEICEEGKMRKEVDQNNQDESRSPNSHIYSSNWELTRLLRDRLELLVLGSGVGIGIGIGRRWIGTWIGIERRRSLRE